MTTAPFPLFFHFSISVCQVRPVPRTLTLDIILSLLTASRLVAEKAAKDRLFRPRWHTNLQATHAQAALRSLLPLNRFLAEPPLSAEIPSLRHPRVQSKAKPILTHLGKQKLGCYIRPPLESGVLRVLPAQFPQRIGVRGATRLSDEVLLHALGFILRARCWTPAVRLQRNSGGFPHQGPQLGRCYILGLRPSHLQERR